MTDIGDIMKNIHLNLRTIISLFVLMTLIGCTTIQIGKNFKLQSFTSNAELGKTNKQQVIKWLGKPMSTGVALKADGQRLDEWSYFYGTGNLPNMENAKIKTLQIRFNNKDVLHSYNSTGEN